MPVGDDKSAVRPNPNMEGSTMHSDRVARGRKVNAWAYAEQEPSPLTVMLIKMRFDLATAQAEAAKGTAADQSIIRKALDSAHAAAKDCAPYVHQRLSSLDKSNVPERNLDNLSEDELKTFLPLLEKLWGKKANNPQQSWGFEGEPPEAVMKDSGTRDATS